MSESDNWMTWQTAHAEALRSLQDAQRTYHRLASERAFAGENEEVKRQTREALGRVDTARRRLDEVRNRQPR
jgi:hypothetical protein